MKNSKKNVNAIFRFILNLSLAIGMLVSGMSTVTVFAEGEDGTDGSTIDYSEYVATDVTYSEDNSLATISISLTDDAESISISDVGDAEGVTPSEKSTWNTLIFTTNTEENDKEYTFEVTLANADGDDIATVEKLVTVKAKEQTTTLEPTNTEEKKNDASDGIGGVLMTLLHLLPMIQH